MKKLLWRLKVPTEYLTTIDFVKTTLTALPAHLNQYKLTPQMLGRKIKGYKPGDPQQLTRDELKYFRKMLIGVLRHWHTNGNSSDWLAEEVGDIGFKVRFKRKSALTGGT
jgi:hypothetical protein